MTEEEHYLAFFSNVDSNICNLELDTGFSIVEMTIKEFKKFIENITQKHKSVSEVLFPRHGIVTREGKIYFLKVQTEIGAEKLHYITHLINKLRLFKEGDIKIPVQFGYAKITNGKIVDVNSIATSMGLGISSKPYRLSDVELKQLNLFIKKIKLPIKYDYIQLALDNLVESFVVTKIKLKFLILMIGFESLFNFGRQQITHTISRHTSIIISKNEKEFEKNYKLMRGFYKIRSALIHADTKSRKRVTIETNDVIKLREILRECIKKIYEIGLDKKELFSYLNVKGFR